MDQRTTTIDQDVKEIVDTRVAIAEKLELLERRIIDTAEGATMKFSRMLEDTTELSTRWSIKPSPHWIRSIKSTNTHGSCWAGLCAWALP